MQRLTPVLQRVRCEAEHEATTDIYTLRASDLFPSFRLKAIRPTLKASHHKHPSAHPTYSNPHIICTKHNPTTITTPVHCPLPRFPPLPADFCTPSSARLHVYANPSPFTFTSVRKHSPKLSLSITGQYWKQPLYVSTAPVQQPVRFEKGALCG